MGCTNSRAYWWIQVSYSWNITTAEYIVLFICTYYVLFCVNKWWIPRTKIILFKIEFEHKVIHIFSTTFCLLWSYSIRFNCSYFDDNYMKKCIALFHAIILSTLTVDSKNVGRIKNIDKEIDHLYLCICQIFCFQDRMLKITS